MTGVREMMAWSPAETSSGLSLAPLPEGSSAHVAISVSGIWMIVLNLCSAALARCDTGDNVITGHLRPLPKSVSNPLNVEVYCSYVLCWTAPPLSLKLYSFAVSD